MRLPATHQHPPCDPLLDPRSAKAQNVLAAMAAPDPFPQTHLTWLGRQLAAGVDARTEVQRHVMEVYAGPLQAYLICTRFRSAGDPTELVHGFFADRLDRTDYLQRWQQSEMPLRRWLANGLLLFVQEQVRRQRRDSRASELPPDLSVVNAPEQALDRAFGRSVVRLAMEQAAQDCESENLTEHWRMFIGHTYEGIAYRDLGSGLGVTPERAAVMARTASKRFRAAVGRILEQDGVPPDRQRRAIADLLDNAG